MLGIVSLTALPNYDKMAELLVIQWPTAWGLICQAEDKKRAERLEKIRRNLVARVANAGGLGGEFSTCFQTLTKDDKP